MVTLNRRNFLKAGAGLGAAVAGVTVATQTPIVQNIASAAAGGPAPEYDTDTDYQRCENFYAPEAYWGTTESITRITPSYHDYETMTENRECKLLERRNRGGAIIKYVNHNSEWLGTTQIIGPIAQHSIIQGHMPRFFTSEQVYWGEAEAEHVGGVGYNPYVKVAGNMLNVADTANMGAINKNKIPIPDPEQMTVHMKDMGYMLGAHEVGVGKTPEAAIMKDQIDYTTMELIPNTVYPYLPYCICMMHGGMVESHLATNTFDSRNMMNNSSSGLITLSGSIAMATYIRELGYNAYLAHGRAGVNVTPCLIAAGMGELSRGGVNLNPRYGTRGQVAIVLTDMPLLPDKPIDAGIQDFCRVCMKCAEVCPVQAIPFDVDKSEHNGYLSWAADLTACSSFMYSRTRNPANNGCCGPCKTSCPWASKEDSWFHQMGTWLGSTGELGSTLLRSVDDIFGYGTGMEALPQYKWWIDWPEIYDYDIPDGADAADYK